MPGATIPSSPAGEGDSPLAASGVRGSPATATIASTATAPARSNRQPVPSTATIVDSTPAAHGPASITSTSANDASTCSARVGEIRPEALADGAASGPTLRTSACINGCAGQRSAIVSRPAVTRLATGAPARNGKTSVSGPGQNFSANVCANGEKIANVSACATLATCTINGLKLGRPLAA